MAGVGWGSVGALLALDTVVGEASAQGVVNSLLEVEVDVGDHGAAEQRGGLAPLDRTALALGRDLAEAADEAASEDSASSTSSRLAASSRWMTTRTRLGGPAG